MQFFSSLFLFLALTLNLEAKLNIIKKENLDSNTTLLVIGGIHGNEPGGYYAPSILATHYKILSKNLWIIPNLNEASILKFRRGIHGDMNRKFAHMKQNDKDKAIVEAIKKIILLPRISLILNLHDGHGFYREKNQGRIYNTKAWGQTCVIDQCKLLKKTPYFNLGKIAQEVKDDINQKLLSKHHSFSVKNTHTKRDHYKDMQQSLTYFAIQHYKPAFAIETSKRLATLSQKVFYQLVAIESYMKIMGIQFKRDFTLNRTSIDKLIKDYGTLKINNNILLNLNDIKKSLSYIPIRLGQNNFEFSNPLGSIKKLKGNYYIYIANHLILQLKPQYFIMASDCQEGYKFEIDGRAVFVPKASEIFVHDNFKIKKNNQVRVNVIGYSKQGILDESDINISYKDLNKKYAVDRDGKVFRVEFYKNKKFCSMIMVHFK
ncbi:putative periplasmic protein [hydrothermal vent metagenome]|uniref:Putative periplasmic protein n=1 Tax=hydrothermal vent metagenome TaxID=652676 RepID=A0A1W1BF89_9ZZZZ